MFSQCVPCVCVLFLIAASPAIAGDKKSGQAEKDTAAPVRLGSARFSNLGRVFAVAFSNDSRLVAGGAWDGSIRVWEAATGKELCQLHEHKGPVRKVVFSPDGKWLASAGKAPGVCLWDLQTGKLHQVLGSAKDDAGQVDFSLDSKHIASVARGKLSVWDLAGKLLWSQGGDRVHTRVAVSAAGSFYSLYLKPLTRSDKPVYADRDDHVYLGRWGLLSGKELDTWDLGQHGSAGMPIVGPGGLVVQRTVIQWGQRETIDYFLAGRREATRRIDITNQAVSVLCVSPDGRMLALSGDSWTADVDRRAKFIRVFELATGQERCRFQSLDQGQLSLAFSPDGRSLAAGSLDVTVLRWDLTQGERQEPQALTTAELDRLWNDLKGSDAAAAYRAHWKLVAAAKQAVPFLARHLRPAAAPDPKRVAALIRDLGDEQFETRRHAHAQLSELEDIAEAALRAGLRASDTLEARRRIEELLARIDQLSPERKAQLRAIEALEHMQTAAATALLRDLAAGAPAASVTRAADEAVQRLERKP